MGIIDTIVQSYSPLRIKNLRYYLSGQVISLIGSWMQLTAQSWVVWELTKSELMLGISAMLGFLPFLVLAPFTGIITDRFDRRKLLIFTQVVSMILAAVFAILVQTHTIQVWHIFILTILLGTVNSLDMPAQMAFIGDLSGVENVRQSVNLNNIIVQVSRMVGPALAGFVIGYVGVAEAFWINSLSFIAVIISLIVITSNQEIKKEKKETKQEFKDAFNFIKQNPFIIDLMILTFIITLFAFPIAQILPSFVSTVLHGNAALLGYLMAASGAGALIGSMFVTPIIQKPKRVGLVLSLCAIWTGFWHVMLSLTNSMPLSILFIFFAALSIPILLTTSNGLVQVLAPPHMKGRVISLILILSFGIMPFGAILIGISAHFLSTPHAIMINAIMIILSTLFLMISRKELLKWEIHHHGPEFHEEKMPHHIHLPSQNKK